MTTNIVIAGLGGQGVLKASDILAEALFRAGYDVKKSEVHGMAQRGGSICSEVRFGSQVLSPMVPAGQADYLVVLAADQVEANRHRLKPAGVLITPEAMNGCLLPNKRCLNVALLGRLSLHLPMPMEVWWETLRQHFPAELFTPNWKAFETGRQLDRKPCATEAKL